EMQGDEPVAIRITMASPLFSSESNAAPPTIAKKVSPDGSPVTGILRRVSLTDRAIVVVGPGLSKTSEMETTLIVPKDVKVSHHQQAARFEDLKEGEAVVVSGEMRDGKLVAKSIEVTR